MNPDAEETTHPEPLDVKTEKPRGDCTGCAFNYQLGTARTGEFKGQLVIRKHNSRTGPGLCDGAQRPPKSAECQHPQGFLSAEDAQGNGGAECPECGERETVSVDPFQAPAAVDTEAGDGSQGPGPVITAMHYGKCADCERRVEPGDNIRATGDGEWVCESCGELLEAAPGLAGHSFSDAAGVMWVHNGEQGDCLFPECKTQVVRTAVTAVADTLGLTAATDRMVAAVQAGHPPYNGNVPETVHNITTANDGRTAEQQAEMDRRMADPVGSALATFPPAGRAMVQERSQALAITTAPVDEFMAPGAKSDIPDGSVSMQPDPDRDRWGRYLIHKQAHTRATTFAKSAASTFTLNEWQQRMVVKGLTMRPDLMALAHGLNVRDDKKTLNSIAEQAKEHAGSKVGANLGTAYHKFSEQIDAGLMTLADVPGIYQPRVHQYLDVMQRAGLTTRREWIERSTAVRAEQVDAQVPVAGTLDRILQLPNGELVIGDLKTGRDLSYSWVEIAVQLALYAHGVNTHGLFDWRTKEWGPIVPPGSATGLELKVRTDFAIVMHLPAEGNGCTLYRVDIAKGWEYAKVCGRVMAMQKDKSLAYELTVPETVAAPAPFPAPPAQPAHVGLTPEQGSMWDTAVQAFYGVDSRPRAAELFQYAMDSRQFSEENLRTLAGIANGRLRSLGL